MRYFICAHGTIQLGISAEHTARLISAAEIQSIQTAGGEVFVSLPDLLRQQNTTAVHALVLKSALKTVLLTARIEKDLEIPEENIRPLPDVFSRLSRYFSGVFFDGENLICIVNTGKIMEGVL